MTVFSNTKIDPAMITTFAEKAAINYGNLIQGTEPIWGKG